MYKDVELRKLPAGPLCRIADILETNNDWKRVMSLIPKNPTDENSGPKYNNEHIRLIEEYAKATNRKCAEILFDEWGTSGKIRPTLGTLYNIVIKAGIYRAADEIALILNESPPTRPTEGPAAKIDTNVTDLLNKMTMHSDRTFKQDTYQKNYDNNKTTAQMKSSANIPAIIKTMGNKTTAQMQSSANIPVVIETMGNKTTAQMQSSANIPVVIESVVSKTTAEVESTPDLIKFSESMIIPDFNALIPNLSPSFSTDNSDISGVPVLNTPEVKLPDISRIDTTILKNTSITHFEYKVLEAVTNNFSNELFYGDRGLSGRIGSGGFGDVFVGYHHQHGYLAVKRFRQHPIFDQKPEVAMKIFNSEVKCLSQLRHPNIVPLIGYSLDGPSLCIVCQYIDGGSVEYNLAAKRLSKLHRMSIMVGTAEGLKYIHQSVKPVDSAGSVSSSSDQNSTKKNNFMHGDVKSANILLTRDCVAKLCDFGLAKHIDSTFITTSLMGTSAYMAPEGFTGTITQKIDIYSFGIVLLELLTGLKPIVDADNEKINIKNYIEENLRDGDIKSMLDPVVGSWEKADEIYELANKCLQPKRHDRPAINVICDTLHRISGV